MKLLTFNEVIKEVCLATVRTDDEDCEEILLDLVDACTRILLTKRVYY